MLLVLAVHLAPRICAAETVPVVGGAYSVIADPTQPVAYVSNDAAMLTVDLDAKVVTRSDAFTSGVNRLDDLDPISGLLAAFSYSVAASASPVTGVQQPLLSGGFFYGVAIAGGHVFAADFNGRVLRIASLDGTEKPSINPYPDATESGGVAGPCGVAASPDRQTVVFGDEFHKAMHVVRVSDLTLVSTIAVGIAPCRMAFLDAQRVVSLATAAFGDDGPVGVLAITHTATPTAPPQAVAVDELHEPTALALDGQTAFVAQNGIDTPLVRAIDLGSGRTLGEIGLARSTYSIALSSDRKRLLIATDQGLVIEPLPLPKVAGVGVAGCVRIAGAPVEGASVRASRGKRKTTATTDRNGCYTLPVAGKKKGKITIELPALP